MPIMNLVKARLRRELSVRARRVHLLAGGFMVLAGYGAATWSWWAGLPLTLLGLPIIGASVWLGRRGRRAPY